MDYSLASGQFNHFFVKEPLLWLIQFNSQAISLSLVTFA